MPPDIDGLAFQPIRWLSASYNLCSVIHASDRQAGRRWRIADEYQDVYPEHGYIYLDDGFVTSIQPL
jgi:hypothetical protein